MQPVCSHIGHGSDQAGGQLALDAEIPDLSLVLLEPACDEEPAKARRRSQSSSGGVGQNNRSNQAIAAQTPKRRERRRRDQAVDSKKWEVSFQGSPGCSEVVREIADPKRSPNGGVALVRRVRHTGSPPSIPEGGLSLRSTLPPSPPADQ